MSRRADKEEAAHLQYETEHTEPPKARSVVIYMAILIAAAFLLLLLAYVMQQRTASTVEGLHQSVNSFQTIDQLVDDNRALQEEVSRLKEERTTLEDNLSQTEAALRQAEAENTRLADEYKTLQLQGQALTALSQLRVLYNGGKYKEARTLIDATPDLESALADISASLSSSDLEIYNPLASYQRIARLLGY